jgi:dolichol kinase
MNGFLVGFLSGVFVGVLLTPVFSPELIGLVAIVLLVLAITLMYLLRRGIQAFGGGE